MESPTFAIASAAEAQRSLLACNELDASLDAAAKVELSMVSVCHDSRGVTVGAGHL